MKNVNEKVAVNAFSNGLKNPELRTIIKPRNYQSLKAAIGGAKNYNNRFYKNSRGRNFSNNVNYRGIGRGNNRACQHGNYNTYKNNVNGHQQNYAL